MLKLKKITILTYFFIFIYFFNINLVFASNHHIMLQAFGWDSINGSPSKWYDLISQKADEIADLGFTVVWFPPPTRSVSQQGYMPTDYYDLGTQDNPTFYGTIDSLKNAINQLHKHQILVLADIVINHRCASHQDENGIWNVYNFPSKKAIWDKNMICNSDKQFLGLGNKDTGDDFKAAPDIDHTNPKVQNDIIEWLNWLKNEIKFDGWRYDYVKGYAPYYVSKYDEATKSKFSVGELWTSLNYQNGMSLYDPPSYDQNPHRQKLCDWLDHAGNIVTAFDFTTKGILQHAVHGEYWRLRDKEGKAAGLIGWWPKRAVTFIDNHDTGSKQQHWPFPSNYVMTGYAYILTHPGIPCVFWEHIYDWNLKNEIKKLISIRKKYQIHSESKLNILRAENNLYVALIDNKIYVKLGANDWMPNDNVELLTSGHHYAVWAKK